MIRTAWLLFAIWKHKHHINLKENQRQTKAVQHNHKTKTTIKYFICNIIQTETTNNKTPTTQTYKNCEQVTVRIENPNNTTERIMIRTTRFLFANWNYNRHMDNKDQQRQTKGVQQEHNTWQNYGRGTNYKQQAKAHVIRYIRKNKAPKQTM